MKARANIFGEISKRDLELSRRSTGSLQRIIVTDDLNDHVIRRRSTTGGRLFRFVREGILQLQLRNSRTCDSGTTDVVTGGKGVAAGGDTDDGEVWRVEGGKPGEDFQGARALATNPTVGSRWVKEQDEEKEQMPLLLQVSSFVTLHLRSREFSMNLSVSPSPPHISFAARHLDSFLLNWPSAGQIEKKWEIFFTTV